MGVTVLDLADRLDISDILTRYATALDTKQWSLLGSVFTDDADCDYGSTGKLHGLEEITRTLRGVLDPLDVTQHALANVTVTVSGDEAVATSYLIAQHVRADVPGGDTYLIGGRYDDRLLRTSAGWRITRRYLTKLWKSGNPLVVKRD